MREEESMDEKAWKGEEEHEKRNMFSFPQDSPTRANSQENGQTAFLLISKALKRLINQEENRLIDWLSAIKWN